jgi:hypothetical protein
MMLVHSIPPNGRRVKDLFLHPNIQKYVSQFTKKKKGKRLPFNVLSQEIENDYMQSEIL